MSHTIMGSSNTTRGVLSYRDKTDITIQILEIANGAEVTKYQIYYEASLNYSRLKEILPMLIDSGLLNYDSKTRTFKTTEKGLLFLQAYNHMNEMLKEHQIF